MPLRLLFTRAAGVSVTLCKTATVKRELRLILMVESTAASGVLHILGQKVSYNFVHSPLRQLP